MSRIEAIKQSIEKNYESCLSTLKECSCDGNDGKQYVCDSKLDAFDFDKLTKKYFNEKKIKKVSMSVDALFFKEKKLYLVEFKNQSRTKKHEIRLKVLESIDLLRAEYGLSNDEYSMIEFILVSNPTKQSENSLKKIKKHVLKGSKEFKKISGLQYLEVRYGILAYEFDNNEFKEHLVLTC